MNQSLFKPYRGKNVKDCVNINGQWYWLTENKDAESRELLGRYNVHCLAWGHDYCDWNSFTTEQKELLKTTLN